MDPITEAICELQITLVNIALDDFEEPYTREERREILFALIAHLSDCVEEEFGTGDRRAAYERLRRHLQVRCAFMG